MSVVLLKQHQKPNWHSAQPIEDRLYGRPQIALEGMSATATVESIQFLDCVGEKVDTRSRASETEESAKLGDSDKQSFGVGNPS